MRPRARKPKEPTAAGARETALRALSRREHSAAELQHKLTRRGHAVEDAAALVERLTESGWQSDARYAEMLVRSRTRQGYGPLRIEHELAAAGVADAGIREALTAADCDWRALCAELRARRFKTFPIAAADWQKQYRFLASHGFSTEQIRAALKGLPEDGLE